MMKSGTLFEEKTFGLIAPPAPLPHQLQKTPRAKKKKIIVISGPTGVGKSRCGILVATAIGGEILSADSMQVYKGMDIGTAKVSKEEQKAVPHHLIDIREISEKFNVVDFFHAATEAIKEIIARGKVPVVVGGTGFYIHALLYGPPQGPEAAQEVRDQLEGEIEKLGVTALYDRLKLLDPTYAGTITQNDRHKIVRALEIISLTNQKVSDFPKSNEMCEDYDFRCWFLHVPKEALYPHLEARCEQMLKDGFVEEVKELEKRGLRNYSIPAQAIGYRQCLEYLGQPYDEEHYKIFVEAFKRASRRYAKRQFTWFRREPLFRWINVANLSLENVSETIIEDYYLSF